MAKNDMVIKVKTSYLTEVVLLVFVMYGIICTYIIEEQDRQVDQMFKTNTQLFESISKYCLTPKYKVVK